MRHADKLIAKAKQCKVVHVDSGPDAYEVTSPSGSVYRVVYIDRINAYRCNCKWGQHNDSGLFPCSHTLAAKLFREEQELGRRVSVWTSKEDAERQHRTTERFGVDGLIVTMRPAGA